MAAVCCSSISGGGDGSSRPSSSSTNVAFSPNHTEAHFFSPNIMRFFSYTLKSSKSEIA